MIHSFLVLLMKKGTIDVADVTLRDLHEMEFLYEGRIKMVERRKIVLKRWNDHDDSLI